MPSAEIITIGTEILLGEIIDTNSAFLARNLRDLNIDVFRTSTIGDNIERIAGIIQETLKRSQIIITTGGLGPTVDDPTRDAVALAFGVDTVFVPSLWQEIVDRMNRFGRIPTENQKKQAYIPMGAIPISNAVGTAPAFVYEKEDKCVISLPGVPKEMEYLSENAVFPYLRKKYNLTGLIKARILHVSGMGEGAIDEKIGDFELLSNPTVGLAAHYGIVDIRITAKSDDEQSADAMIDKVEQDIRSVLGKAIFGSDNETLEGLTLNHLALKNWKMAVVEINTGGELTRSLSVYGSDLFTGGKISSVVLEKNDLADLVKSEMSKQKSEVGLGLQTRPINEKLEIDLVLITPNNQKNEIRGYGGHPKNLAIWGANSALEMLRSELTK